MSRVAAPAASEPRSAGRLLLAVLCVTVLVLGGVLARVVLLGRADAGAVERQVSLAQGLGPDARADIAVRDTREMIVSTNGAKRAGLVAATEAVELILSFDHRHLEEDVARAAQRQTGTQRERYLATMEALAEDAAERRTRVVARVVGAGAVTATAHDVKALLFVDQTTRRRDLEVPRTARNRVLVTLHRDEGAWSVVGLVAV